MKLNNKGFTLVEVLAVLVILSIIISITIPTFSSSLDRNKSKQNFSRYEVLKAQAALWVSDNLSYINNNNIDVCYIKISTLINEGYTSSMEATDIDGNSVADNYIKYTIGSDEYEYVVGLNKTPVCSGS